MKCRVQKNILMRGENMSLAVCSGALCSCSFGMTPSALRVSSQNKCMSPASLATIEDNAAMKNVMPFGLCKSMSNPTVASATAAALGTLTPQPCTPMITKLWMPGSDKVFFGGKPALTSDSKLSCMYGGVISIVNAGQLKLMID